MKLQNARGTRDFPPEEAIARQRLASALKEVFELFGYNPLETPVLERYDVLASKYAGGAEILKETFRLEDQGGRELGLRYDLTVPLSRFLAMNPKMKLPFKRFQIAEVFRDGPIKLGRYRQFVQCDIDVIGVKDMTADAEIISMLQLAFSKLDLGVTIKVNNRKVMNGILEDAGVRKEKAEAAILAIDKLEKIGKEGVVNELNDKKIPGNAIGKLMELAGIKGTSREKLALLESLMQSGEGKEGIGELKQLFELLADDSNVDLQPSLARGLSYYTGTVFEAFLKDSEIGSAVAGGGRYDEMVGRFLGSGKEYPAVGVSLGFEVILDAMRLKIKSEERSVAKAYVIPIKNYREASKVASELRSGGIKTDIDLLNRSISKNMEYASSQSIPFVVFVGEQELKQGKVKLRNMKTGDEALVSVNDAIHLISNTKI
ncbi:histidine--tRNA ligase [Candidatus Woesearchaeota archaeon]|nr:histidine--tRNA ligase [Candidatus Woesearchaeota archaeon]